MNQIMQQEGITEEVKSRDQIEWVRQANNVRSRSDHDTKNYKISGGQKPKMLLGLF